MRWYKVLLMVILFAGCTVIAPEVESPEHTNPLDPENPLNEPTSQTYTRPTIEIVSGPEDGTTLDTADVKFTWQGNKSINEFKYKLDSDKWSDWGQSTSIIFELLDDGKHSFKVMVRDRGVQKSDSASVSRTFNVKAIKGPALRFYPRLSQVSLGQEDTVNVVLEEVNGVIGLKVVFTFDPTILSVLSLNVPDSVSNDFSGVKPENLIGLELFDSEEAKTGRVALNIGVVDVESGLSGTGAIAEIKFTAKREGSTKLTFDREASELRDYDDRQIKLNDLGNGKVKVSSKQ